MKIIYKNDFGTIAMFGEDNNGFSICDIDGLNLHGKERSLVHFHNKDGYDEADSFWGQRVITISGDIKSDNTKLLKDAIRIFSRPGTLTVDTVSGLYSINVNDTTFKTQRKNNMYKTYCVQFSCDFPHFSDNSDILSGAYSRKNLITSETFLPAVFSSRTAGGIIENTGDIPIEPTITIKCLADSPEDGFISIENKTTGKKIIIDYKVALNEIITIDIPKRIITSSVKGDITSHLNPESYLCDISLICGENYIDVTPSAGNRNCEVYIVYRNLYTGVIV